MLTSRHYSPTGLDGRRCGVKQAVINRLLGGCVRINHVVINKVMRAGAVLVKYVLTAK